MMEGAQVARKVPLQAKANLFFHFCLSYGSRAEEAVFSEIHFGVLADGDRWRVHAGNDQRSVLTLRWSCEEANAPEDSSFFSTGNSEFVIFQLFSR